jgi:hypothetical protein
MHRIEHNVETGKIKEIQLTPEEIAEYENKAREVQAQMQAEAEALAAKAAARQAILDRLGLTADEAALLLGAN